MIKRNLSEPVMLMGEGEYNINNMKELKVTESFLGLDLKDRGCQNEETMEDCSTRQHIDACLQECGCLPFSVSILNNVYVE